MGFLYPAFNERMEDRESIAFYSKDTKKFDDAFVNTCLGCYLPTSANTQQTIFSESLSETYDDKCSFDLVENITEKVKELSESNAKERYIVISTVLHVSLESYRVARFQRIFFNFDLEYNALKT